MTAPPRLHLDARLVPDVHSVTSDLPGSWYISLGLGTPAAGTYTEVAFGPAALAAAQDGTRPEREVMEEAVRLVAVSLYGTAWAFVYSPEQAADAIHRHSLRRRERAYVSAMEVWE